MKKLNVVFKLSSLAAMGALFIFSSCINKEYDLDKDGKMDICVYQGAKPATTAPASNVIEIGKNYTLTEGTKGNLTYYASETYAWDESRDYLWPIPEDQRQITNGALSQNPGWTDGL